MDHLVTMQCSAVKTLGPGIHVDATWHPPPNWTLLQAKYTLSWQCPAPRTETLSSDVEGQCQCFCGADCRATMFVSVEIESLELSLMCPDTLQQLLRKVPNIVTSTLFQPNLVLVLGWCKRCFKVCSTWEPFKNWLIFPWAWEPVAASFSHYIHIHFTALLGTITELWNWLVYSPKIYWFKGYLAVKMQITGSRVCNCSKEWSEPLWSKRDKRAQSVNMAS